MINHILVFKVHIGCCSQMVLNEVIFHLNGFFMLKIICAIAKYLAIL